MTGCLLTCLLLPFFIIRSCVAVDFESIHLCEYLASYALLSSPDYAPMQTMSSFRKKNLITRLHACWYTTVDF